MEEDDENIRREIKEMKQENATIPTPTHDLDTLNEELNRLKGENISSQEQMKKLQQKLNVKYISVHFRDFLFLEIDLFHV